MGQGINITEGFSAAAHDDQHHPDHLSGISAPVGAFLVSATVALLCYICFASKPLTWCSICGTFFPTYRKQAKACPFRMCQLALRRLRQNALTARNPVIAECVVCDTDFRKVGNAKVCSSPACHAVLIRRQLEHRYVKMKARRTSDPAYREHLRQQCRETQKRLRQDDSYRIAQNLRIYEWRERKELVASGIVSGEDAIP